MGGAIRDQLLGLPIKERDFVVVGATVSDLVQRGFRQVGKSFPVFLHPETNEEYALARTEQKIGPGYQGFEFNATQFVTLEEDLKRRDLTINAIAQSQDGELIDPYGGITDLQNRVLRHVSSAFVEDPVRLLRTARFAAQFAKFGFKVAPETLALMHRMVDMGEVNHLVAERVWHELVKALMSMQPHCFFDVIKSAGALPVLFPELVSFSVLDNAASVTDDVLIRFAALFDQVDEIALSQFCRRLRVPKAHAELAKLCVKHSDKLATISLNHPSNILDLLHLVDAFRRESRFERFLVVCQLYHPEVVQQTKLLKSAWQACQTVTAADSIAAGKTGPMLAKDLYQRRVNAIAKLIFG